MTGASPTDAAGGIAISVILSGMRVGQEVIAADPMCIQGSSSSTCAGKGATT